MPLTDAQKESILQNARALIGMKYDQIDCSNFVHRAYAAAKVTYPYRATASFDDLTIQYFNKLEASVTREAADVLMFSGHVGLWDPGGCTVLETAKMPNPQCQSMKNNVPVLSSRSGKNRGPDFGQAKWFGEVKAVYRWK